MESGSRLTAIQVGPSARAWSAKAAPSPNPPSPTPVAHASATSRGNTGWAARTGRVATTFSIRRANLRGQPKKAIPAPPRANLPSVSGRYIPISLDGQGVEGRPDPPRHLERRGAEQDLPDPVAGAVGGQLVEGEHLAQRESHVADAEGMDGQGEGGVLEGDDLDRAGVAGDRRDLPRMQPLHARDAETGHLPHVALAVAVTGEDGEVPGADEEDVAAPGAHALRALGGLQRVGTDHLAGAEPLHAARARQIEEHAARHDAAPDLVDRVALGPGGAERRRGRSVVEPSVVIDVRQAVPLRRALERHRDGVVGV